jgi:hypothetical protein
MPKQEQRKPKVKSKAQDKPSTSLAYVDDRSQSPKQNGKRKRWEEPTNYQPSLMLNTKD